MRHRLADFGVGADQFEQIAHDALDDEVLVNAPITPTAEQIAGMLAAVG